MFDSSTRRRSGSSGKDLVNTQKKTLKIYYLDYLRSKNSKMHSKIFFKRIFDFLL